MYTIKVDENGLITEALDQEGNLLTKEEIEELLDREPAEEVIQ